jgi:hypothetical protein
LIAASAAKTRGDNSEFSRKCQQFNCHILSIHEAIRSARRDRSRSPAANEKSHGPLDQGCAGKNNIGPLGLQTVDRLTLHMVLP